jgi:hypothetical protein
VISPVLPPEIPYRYKALDLIPVFDKQLSSLSSLTRILLSLLLPLTSFSPTMPFTLNKVIDAVRPGSSRRSSTSSVRRQSKSSSSPSSSSPLASPVPTPRESTYAEVPEIYYNARLDPKNFLEGQFLF